MQAENEAIGAEVMARAARSLTSRPHEELGSVLPLEDPMDVDEVSSDPETGSLESVLQLCLICFAASISSSRTHSAPVVPGSSPAPSVGSAPPGKS
jgi:hypothetical protein